MPRAALLAFALLAPVASWAQSSRGRLPPSSSPFSGGVTAQGRIVPVGGVIRVAAPVTASGQAIVDQLLVKSGDIVQPGQLLAQLQGRATLQAQINAAAADHDAATAALAQAQAAQTRSAAEFAVQVANLTGQADAAEAAVRRAIATTHLAVEQARSEQTAAQTAVDNAKHLQAAVEAASAANVTLAQLQLDAIPKTLHATDRGLATAQLNQAKTEKARADGEFANQVAQLQAQADLAAVHVRQAEALQVTEAPANLSPEQAQAQSAHAAVDAEKKLAEAAAAEAAAAVATAQARVASTDAALASARAQLALTEVHAPAAGRVLAIITNPGEAVGPGGLLQLGDTRDMYVDSLVYIDDVPSIHLGQKTLTTGPALPDDGVTGQVVDISPMVAGNTLPNPDPTVFSDQPVVLVKVRLDNPAAAANLVNGQVKVQFAP